MFKFHFRGNSGESTPGFGGRLAKLSQSLEEAVAAKGVADTARDLAMFTTGFGYGYHNEIATAYYMKYMSVISVPAYEFAEFGYGTLCTRVAETLDVRLNQVVAKVTRAPDGVTIETSDTRFEAEYLLIASPLDEALGYLDATPREIELYERIRYYNYQVVGAEVTGLSHLKRFSFFQSRVTPSSAGRPVFICKRWPDRDIVLFYVLGESSVGGTVKLESQAVDNCILEDIKALGGTLVKFHERRSWKYFPHVTPAEFASGFHERLETLQGQNRTFLTGELLNFSSVETVMNYSRHVIENLVLPGLSFRKVG